MADILLRSPASPEALAALRAGDRVLLSGVIYTARDAAHARLFAALERGEELPVDLRGASIYYAGPTPTPPGRVSGAIGPTTSTRMDKFTPALLRYGVRVLIGKGDRSESVAEALRENGAVYLAAPGGCAAYMARCVKELTVVAYDDLGTESIKRLTVENMPLTVVLDTCGGNAYRDGRAEWLASPGAMKE